MGQTFVHSASREQDVITSRQVSVHTSLASILATSDRRLSRTW